MIRLIRRLGTAALLVVAAAPAIAAECAPPGPAPVMPQGATFSKNEMAAGKVSHDKYVDIVQAFKECQQKRIASAPKGTKPELLKSWRDSIATADDTITAVDFIFQSQMWSYEARAR